MINNFIDIPENERDKYIYRVFPFERLIQMFNEKKNVLVKPKKWDDPFENFIMNSTGKLDDGSLFKVGFRDNFYGQCWTRTRESDGLWRIYSPEKNGVRIRSTPRKLLKSLYSTSGEFSDINSFIGKVSYYSTPKLEILLQNNINSWILDNTGKGQAKTLLFKRTPFKHENEVRIIFNSNGSLKKDIYKYTIDPFKLIDDIGFDPRLEYELFSKRKSALRKIGFSKRIVKSKLYHFPKYTFTLNNN